MNATASPARTGLILGIGAYVTWGLLPLYLKLLAGVPAFQVVAHRILWSVALLVLVVLAMRRGAAIRAAARGRTLLLLCGSAGLIAVNWLVYIWAVQHAHVLEASLGYFINPLLNVALGMIVLGERIGTLQKAAVAVGHSILVIAYHVLEREVPYEELGEDYFDRQRSREAYTKRLVRKLERLGHKVALEPLPQST